jgi:MATE family multidrug resistance protein
MVPLFHPLRPVGTLWTDIERTLALAFPVMMARAGRLIMIAVDTAMCGRAGEAALAHYGISLAPHNTLMVVAFGALSGMVVLVAQANGAGRPEACGRLWRLGLIIAGILGLIHGAVMLAGERILAALGQPPGIAAGGGDALLGFAPGMPAILLFAATVFFLEGIGRPRAGMIIALAANFLNAGLNWILIFGHWGFPAMGAEGAAIATSIARWAMFAAALAYVLGMPDRDRYGVLAPMKGYFRQCWTLLRLGGPLALGAGLETTAFAAVALLAGWLGSLTLAAYQIVINVNALIFMLALGLSTAATVRVGNAVGQRDPSAMARSGWSAVLITIAVMAIFGAAAAIARDPIASFYTDDAPLHALAAAALVVIGGLIVIDGLQAVLMGAVRGTADAVVPSIIQAFAFWVVAVPAAYWLGIDRGHGIFGLLGGLFLGVTTASLLLGWRFHGLARRWSGVETRN